MNLTLSARTLGTLLLLPALAFSRQPVADQSTELKTESSDIATLRSSAANGDAVAERKLAEAYDQGSGVGQRDRRLDPKKVFSMMQSQ